MARGVRNMGRGIGVLEMGADTVAEGFEAVEIDVAVGDALHKGAPVHDGGVGGGGDDGFAVFDEGAEVAEEVFEVEAA